MRIFTYVRCIKTSKFILLCIPSHVLSTPALAHKARGTRQDKVGDVADEVEVYLQAGAVLVAYFEGVKVHWPRLIFITLPLAVATPLDIAPVTLTEAPLAVRVHRTAAPAAVAIVEVVAPVFR